MSTFYKVYVEDILNSIDKIEKLLINKTWDDIKEHMNQVKDILKQLKVIGEAAKYIPEEVRNKFKKISWTRILGLRDIMEHEFGIDQEIIYTISKSVIEDMKQDFIQLYAESE